jgi:UDP-N-acetylmuramoylalanine--D-glutamate ligase
VAQTGSDINRAVASVVSFEPLPHRLQVLGTLEGVTCINDSIASTPVSTLAALEALAGRPVVLLLGGFDRGLDWSRHAAAFRQFAPKAIIGLPASGPRIINALKQEHVEPVCGFHEAKDLAAAVNLARQLAVHGDTVLLSPGAPSFPQFIDYQDRGRVFARLCGFESSAA